MVIGILENSPFLYQLKTFANSSFPKNPTLLALASSYQTTQYEVTKVNNFFVWLKPQDRDDTIMVQKNIIYWTEIQETEKPEIVKEDEIPARGEISEENLYLAS